MHAISTQITHNTAETELRRGSGRGVRLPAVRAAGDLPLRDAAALPRQPGQLGSGAHRCARGRARGHPGRLPGVGSSRGEFGPTIAETATAHDRVHRRARPDEIDLLGFSIGGFIAQEIALIRPTLVRRLVLAATGPKGAPGMHGWREDIADRRARREQAARTCSTSCSPTPRPARPRGWSSSAASWSAGGPRRGDQRRRPRRPVRRDRRVGHPRPRRTAAADRDQDPDADHPGRQRPDDPDQAQPPDGRADPGRADPDLPRRGAGFLFQYPAEVAAEVNTFLA